MSLAERVSAALELNAERTAHYAFDVRGVTADAGAKAFVRKALKNQPTSTAENDESYLALIRTGTPRYTAARKLGLSPVAVHRRLKIDMVFLEQVLVAEAESTEPAQARLRELALQDEKWAILKLLEAKNDSEFGAKDKNINVNVNHTVVEGEDPIDARIRQLMADLQAQRETKQLGAVIDVESFEDTDE